MSSLSIRERRAPGATSAAAAPEPAQGPAGVVVCVLVPAVVMAILGLIGLRSRSIGFDEAATAAIASQHGSALWRAIAHDGGNMSAYYLLMHGLIAWFGDGLLVLRLPSLIAACVMTGTVGAIGRRLGGTLVGLSTGVLAAVSLPVVYWAQTARAYAPMLAFLCLGLLAFLIAAEAPEGGVTGRRAAAAYVAAMVLACYCSLIAVLVVPVEILAVLWRPVARRRLLRAILTLAVLCIPLVVLALARGSGQLFWVPRPSSRVDTQVLEAITSAGLEPSFRRTATTYPLIVVTLVALGLVLVWLLARWRGRPGRDTWAPGLLLALFAVPVVATFAASLVTQPILVPRNILITAPAAGLALVVALHRARVPRALLVVLVLLLLGGRMLQVTAAAGVSPEPWRAVTARVLAAARPGDCIAFYPEDARSPFAYEVQAAGRAAERRAPRSILPRAPWSRLRADVEAYATLSPAEVSARGAGCRRMWVVSSHEGQPDGPARSRENRTRWQVLVGRLERRFGRAPVRSDGYASTIHVQLLPGRRG